MTCFWLPAGFKTTTYTFPAPPPMEGKVLEQPDAYEAYYTIRMWMKYPSNCAVIDGIVEDEDLVMDKGL